MSNFGFGFNRGQFGGGMRFPFGGGGAAGQGGFQPRPFQGGMQIQQRPGFPGLQSNYRTLLHRPNQPPVQQIQQAARPMVPPATRGAGGSFGAGAAIQGDVNGAGRLARPLMDNTAAFGGFLSVPPEPTRPTMPPTGNAGARSSFANSPARQWTPLEQATMNRFEADQAMNQLQDANPNFRDNLAGSMEWDRGIIEKGMVPDVNDPNFQGITPQQAFQQIPGNSFNIMRDRFDAIKANRPPVEPPMTASQATSTMPNYQQRLAQADPRVSGIVNDGYAMSDADNRITPMPRVSKVNDKIHPSQLTETERARIGAVGGSAREWEAKSKWMAKNGYEQWTPDAAQAYTAERQQKRLSRDDQDFALKMQRIMKADAIREMKAKQAGQLYQRQNPELFTQPDFVAAQLQSSLAGGSLQRFEQEGLSPENQAAVDLQNRQYNLERAEMEQDPIKKQQILRSMDAAGGGGYGPQGGGGSQNPWLNWQGGLGGQGQPTQGMPIGDVVFRQENTTPETAQAKLQEWYSNQHRPSQQELDAEGISEQDIEDFKNSNVSSFDWMKDKVYGLNFLAGDNSTDERTAKYQWAGGLSGKKPTWWDNQFGAGWNPQTGESQGYAPGSEAEGQLASGMEEWLPWAAAAGASMLPLGRIGKALGIGKKTGLGLKVPPNYKTTWNPENPARGFTLKPGSAPPTSPVRPARPPRGLITTPKYKPSSPPAGGSSQGGELMVRPPLQGRPVGPPVRQQYQPQGQIGQQSQPLIGGQPNKRLPYYPPEGGIPGMNPPMGPAGVPLVPRNPPGMLGGYAMPGYSNPQLLQNPAYIQRLKELELEFSGVR